MYIVYDKKNAAVKLTYSEWNEKRRCLLESSSRVTRILLWFQFKMNFQFNTAFNACNWNTSWAVFWLRLFVHFAMNFDVPRTICSNYCINLFCFFHKIEYKMYLISWMVHNLKNEKPIESVLLNNELSTVFLIRKHKCRPFCIFFFFIFLLSSSRRLYTGLCACVRVASN